MKTKSRNFLITSLMIIAILFSVVPIAPFTAFAQGVITVPTIVSVGGIEVDQETTMGGAPSVLVGQPYYAQVVATGGDLTYSAGAGEYMNLPEGLTINAETGLISGTCTEETGRYNCLIKATNAMGEASVVIGITVGDSSCIPGIETVAGSLGQTYKNSNSQFIVSATNNNASMSIYNFSWSIKSGALPDGMKLSYTSSRTVYITGTPTATGTFNFELEVKNDFGTASRSYSISVIEGSVSPNIVASGESLGYGVVGKPYEYQLEATGTNTNEDTMLWSTDSDDFSQESYDLGNGLSMSKTGLITGTPQSNTQVSFYVYAKNSVGTDNESFYILIYNNGEATTSAITPEVAVVAKGSSKEFTVSLEGYGDVEQVAYWSFYMWDDELGSAFPQPTDSELSVNTSTPSKTVTLTVGENETRGQIRVVAYSKPGNGGVKTWATVTIVEKAAVVYNVSFDKNGGTGSMADATGVSGDYVLPVCGFTAPNGKQFKAWSVGGVEKAVGDKITVTANTTVTAVWENIPQQDQPITAIVISCSGYVVGGNIAEAVPTTSSTGVTIASYEWQDNNGTKLTSGTFAADAQYRLRVFLNVADGYTANSLEKANVKINGTETTYFTNPCIGVDAQYGDMMIYHYPARLTAPQPTEYMVSYNANGGSGTMVGDMVEENGKFTLKNCTYIAPEGYKFKAWAIGSVNGEQKQPGEQITITGETYIFAIWEAIEYNVTGTVTSFNDASADITLQLIPEGLSDPSYETIVKGNTVDYYFADVAAGTYTLKVSKNNHVTREYAVVVGNSSVIQDVKLQLKGDINGDGKVNTSDVGKANAHVKKVSTLTGYEFACADVNGDGKVNTSDVGKMNAHVKKTSLLW